MAFWDELQKGVTDAASFTAKKTTELTDLARLKINIHSEENKLERCFTEIGRAYYNSKKSGEDASSEISTLIMQADKISADIDNLKRETAQLRRVSFCFSCGAEVSDDCVFCPTCGNKLSHESDGSQCCDNECTCDKNCDCENDDNE